MQWRTEPARYGTRHKLCLGEFSIILVEDTSRQKRVTVTTLLVYHGRSELLIPRYVTHKKVNHQTVELHSMQAVRERAIEVAKGYLEKLTAEATFARKLLTPVIPIPQKSIRTYHTGDYSYSSDEPSDDHK